jgi:hypothetical protein
VASRFFALGTVILLRSSLDGIARRIAYAEPSDLAAIVLAQHNHAANAHQIQTVTVAQKRMLLVTVAHAPTLHSEVAPAHP